MSRQKHGIHQTPALHFVHLAERSALTLPADREVIYSSLRPASLPLAREHTVATQQSQRSAELTGSRCFPRTEFPQRLQSPVSRPALTMRAQSGGNHRHDRSHSPTNVQYLNKLYSSQSTQRNGKSKTEAWEALKEGRNGDENRSIVSSLQEQNQNSVIIDSPKPMCCYCIHGTQKV